MFIERGAGATSLLAVVCLISTMTWSQAQPQLSNFDRSRAQTILQVVANEIKKHYYDPKFHGVDWDAKVAEARQKIEKATSFNMAMSHIAAALDTLNDSHTFLLPPQHSYHHDYEWQYQIVGNRCFVTRVRPKTGAEAKGVKAGDEILTINGYDVNREDFWKVQYVFSVLRPQAELRMGLQDPSGAQRHLDVMARIREGKKVMDLTGANGASDIWDLVR